MRKVTSLLTNLTCLEDLNETLHAIDWGNYAEYGCGNAYNNPLCAMTCSNHADKCSREEYRRDVKLLFSNSSDQNRRVLEPPDRDTDVYGYVKYSTASNFIPPKCSPLEEDLLLELSSIVGYNRSTDPIPDYEGRVWLSESDASVTREQFSKAFNETLSLFKSLPSPLSNTSPSSQSGSADDPNFFTSIAGISTYVGVGILIIIGVVFGCVYCKKKKKNTPPPPTSPVVKKSLSNGTFEYNFGTEEEGRISVTNV